jgi:anaerobic selenocysteine-containing dehydrogenase
MAPTSRLHTCMLCEAVCGVELQVENDRITSVRGDAQDPFSQGHLCPKAAALPDIAHDPDRLRQPVRRVGDRWEPVSWPAAIAEAGEKLAAIQNRHGRHSVAIYLGNPTVHSYSALLAAPLFGKLVGTRSRYSATSVDQLPQMLAAWAMLGHPLRLPIPDVDRTDFLLMLGANPLASNGSLMTAPGIRRRLEALKARGGKLVVIDPRRTETAALAHAHHFIRPGGDAPLLLAMLQTIFAEKLERPGPHLAQLEELRAAVSGYTPEKVASRTGLPSDAIRTLAREFAGAKTATCYGRVGICTQEFGGLAAWAVTALNAVTGNLDRAGGAMFPTPAVDLVGLLERLGNRGHFGVWKSRVRGLPEFFGELPVATLAEEMETPGEGQIRGLITFAGNPALSTPNGPRMERALAGLEFMVSIDLYRNETTRHANLILPTPFGAERDHYDVAFYALAVRNAARYVEPALTAPPEVRDDWEVLLDLGLAIAARRKGKKRRGPELTARAAKALGSRRILDLLLRTGPHGAWRGGKLSLAELKRHPHGVDLGPLEPRFPGVLATRDHRVQLLPELFRGDLPRLERSLSEGTNGLVLIGRRHLRSNNSWMHNAERLVKGRDRCTLMIHPGDASSRGITEGARVKIRTRVGEVEGAAELTEEISPGVVSLPHGWGHHRPGTSLQIAGAHAGVSLNDLTDDARVDALSGNASFSGVPVEVLPV